MKQSRNTAQKREAEEDVRLPTLGQVAEEERFALLRELIKAVDMTPVNELGEELRKGFLEDASAVNKPTLRLMQAFLGACDARTGESERKRAHIASRKDSSGKTVA